VKQVTIRPSPRNRAVRHDRELTRALEYARLRNRGYSHAQAARLATLHTPDAAA
jgi:hypothetical protein